MCGGVRTGRPRCAVVEEVASPHLNRIKSSEWTLWVPGCAFGCHNRSFLLGESSPAELAASLLPPEQDELDDSPRAFVSRRGWTVPPAE